MTKLYKNIIKNFAAVRAALIPLYKSIYKLLYIKQLQQYYIVQLLVKTITYLLKTMKYVLMFGTFGTVIWYALYFTLNYFEIPINIDLTFITSVLTSILSFSIIEKLYAPIRTFITKLNANLLYKLMDNPNTIESAKKLNKKEAPRWSKGYSKGSLQGKRIIITLEFSEFYDTIGPGRGDYPVHKADFIYIPKKMYVDGAVSFIRKYSSKIQQQNSKAKLFFGNTHFYFLHSLTIVIPKDPQDTQNG